MQNNLKMHFTTPSERVLLNVSSVTACKTEVQLYSSSNLQHHPVVNPDEHLPTE